MLLGDHDLGRSGNFRLLVCAVLNLDMGLLCLWQLHGSNTPVWRFPVLLFTLPLFRCLQNTEAEAHEQLSYALDQGINFIDTAGESE